MDFEKVIRTRRSIRRYTEKEIPQDVLSRILDAARVAPSGNNHQPWKFVVVRNRALKEKIAEFSYGQSFIAAAPVVIVCCSEKYPNSYEPHRDLAHLIDTVIAIDHLVLAARNEGVGSCWIGAFDGKSIGKLLGFGSGMEVVMVIPLGYPVSEDAFRESSGRKTLKEITYEAK